MSQVKEWIYFGSCVVLLIITLYQQYKLEKFQNHLSTLSIKMLEVMFLLNLMSKGSEEDDKKILND